MRKANSSSLTTANNLVQVAALPLKIDDDGNARVLLLTSRETQRWIIPKGWPMQGRAPSQAAAREALEEAGIIGKPERKPIGTYSYLKRLKAHFETCRVDVYLLRVKGQAKRWREKGQRQVRWATLDEAAELVQEPGLIALFRSIARSQTIGHTGPKEKAPPQTEVP